MEQKNIISDFMNSFIVGGISSAVHTTFSAPTERVKLLLQTQDANPKLIKMKYNGIINCFVRCVREEGFLSLWRGNWPNILKYFPNTAFSFAFKDIYVGILRSVISNTNPENFFWISLISGGAAGVTSSLVTYPFDFARTRLAVDVGRTSHERDFKGLTDCWMKIYRNDGIVGLYKGFGASILSIFAYRACYFGGHDIGRKYLFKDAEKTDFLAKFAFAQFITLFSGIMAYPFDTIKRRLMMQSGRTEPLYTSTLQCARNILTKEGFTGFYKGNLLFIISNIGNALALVIYDEMTRGLFTY